MPRRDSAPPGCSLLIRNLSRNTRADDLRYTAEKYGRLRDVYLPRDFYTGEPRGIGFLEFIDARDAEDAKDALDRAMIHGREVSVVFAQQGRKGPDEYRPPPRRSGERGRRSYSRSPRRRSSRSPRRRRSPSRSPSRGRSRSPRRKSRRRSPTPSASRSPAKRYSEEPSRSRSPAQDAKAEFPARGSPAASPAASPERSSRVKRRRGQDAL